MSKIYQFPFSFLDFIIVNEFILLSLVHYSFIRVNELLFFD